MGMDQGQHTQGGETNTGSSSSWVVDLHRQRGPFRAGPLLVMVLLRLSGFCCKCKSEQRTARQPDANFNANQLLYAHTNC